MKEKKDRIDDALLATKAAVEEGIVVGGGAALIHARELVNGSLSAENSDIEPVIYEGEEIDEMDEESAQMYIDKSKEFKEMKPEKIRKSSVEPSLLAKVGDLPTAEELDISSETDMGG